jgi:hypothetical protein
MKLWNGKLYLSTSHACEKKDNFVIKMNKFEDYYFYNNNMSVSQSIPASIKSWVSARDCLHMWYIGLGSELLNYVLYGLVGWHENHVFLVQSVLFVKSHMFFVVSYSLPPPPPPPPHWGPCVCCLLPPPCQGLCFIQRPRTNLWAFFLIFGGEVVQVGGGRVGPSHLPF